jgi:hypothetical protein
MLGRLNNGIVVGIKSFYNCERGKVRSCLGQSIV